MAPDLLASIIDWICLVEGKLWKGSLTDTWFWNSFISGLDFVFLLEFLNFLDVWQHLGTPLESPERLPLYQAFAQHAQLCISGSVTWKGFWVIDLCQHFLRIAPDLLASLIDFICLVESPFLCIAHVLGFPPDLSHWFRLILFCASLMFGVSLRICLRLQWSQLLLWRSTMTAMLTDSCFWNSFFEFLNFSDVWQNLGTPSESPQWPPPCQAFCQARLALHFWLSHLKRILSHWLMPPARHA